MVKKTLAILFIFFLVLQIMYCAALNDGDLQNGAKKGHSLIVYIDGSEILAKNQNGDIIAKGITGIDDSKIIKDAIDYLNRGSILLVGSFKITSIIDNFKSGICLQGIQGQTKFDCSGIKLTGREMSSHRLAFSNGEYGYSSLIDHLTEDAYAGMDTIKVENSQYYSKGDYIKIVDDYDISGFKNGRIYKIYYIDGNEIYLDKYLTEDYAHQRNANIRKLVLTEDVTIEGIEFIGPGMDTDDHFMENFLQKNFTFRNNTIRFFGESALELYDSMDCTIYGNIFEYIYKPEFGYSTVISNACENVSVKNNIFRGKGRHYIVCTAGHGTDIDGGFARQIKILNNYFEKSTSEAINTHEPFMGPIIIANNTCVSCEKGIAITNGNSDVHSNKFINCIIGIKLWAGEGRIYNIYSNYFEKCSYPLLIQMNHSQIYNTVCNGKFYLSKDELTCL